MLYGYVKRIAASGRKWSMLILFAVMSSFVYINMGKELVDIFYDCMIKISLKKCEKDFIHDRKEFCFKILLFQLGLGKNIKHY